MAVPMAYWIARERAVVFFLSFSHHRRTWDPMALMAVHQAGRGLEGRHTLT